MADSLCRKGGTFTFVLFISFGVLLLLTDTQVGTLFGDGEEKHY